MSLVWNGNAAKQQIVDASGKGLLLCAAYFRGQLKLRLGVSNPKPYLNSSKPGEYPKLRTGIGRVSHTHDPTTAAAIAAAGYVRLGYTPTGWYMGYLEQYKARLGLVHTMQTLQPQLAQILADASKG